MAVNDTDWATVPLATDQSVKNTSGADIAQGDIVTLHSTISTTAPSVNVKQSTTDDLVYGVAIENIPNGKQGRVRTVGIAQCRCDSAITFGTAVQASTLGNAKTCAAGKAQLGIALNTTTTTGDKLLVDIARARNA